MEGGEWDRLVLARLFAPHALITDSACVPHRGPHCMHVVLRCGNSVARLSETACSVLCSGGYNMIDGLRLIRLRCSS